MSDTEPREITNDMVFISAIEPVLWAGCDFRLFWCLAGTCLLSAIFIFAVCGITLGLAWGESGVAAAFFAGRAALRMMAKHDPLLVPVYLRHIQWPGWIPATGKVLAQRRYNKLFSVQARKASNPFVRGK